MSILKIEQLINYLIVALCISIKALSCNLILVFSMKKRAQPENARKCQTDFNSPVTWQKQDSLQYIYDMPPHKNRFNLLVWRCAGLMRDYLANCPGGKSWGQAKLTNIHAKRKKQQLLES